MHLTPVLMYHAIGRPHDSRFRPWVVSPGLLSEHLSVLRESGYELIGLSEWALRSFTGRCAVLTFDDGYSDFMDEAMPVLSVYRARSTAYVITSYVGGCASWLPFHGERGRRLMTWEDLRHIRERGVEIGSHGHRHIALDTAPQKTAQADVRRSRAELAEQGFDAKSFCYPFGYANRSVREIVARAGFTTGCIVGRGLADPHKDPLRVRRLMIDHRTSPETLLRRIHGPELMPAARLRQVAQPAWRLARRACAVSGMR